MTDTSPKRLRELADWLQDHGFLGSPGILREIAAEKEARDDEADEMDTVAIEFAHRLAMNLECLILECPASSRFYDESLQTLSAYRGAMNAIHERISPTHMGEPVLEKWTHSLAEQPVEMAKPADVPLPVSEKEAQPSPEPFVVKHYSGDEHPVIKGNGFDGLEVGESREDAEEFVAWVNAKLKAPQLPAVVPLPEPDCASDFHVHTKVYTADFVRQYGQACAKAARDAAFDECLKELRFLRDECERADEPDAMTTLTSLRELLLAAKKGTP